MFKFFKGKEPMRHCPICQNRYRTVQELNEHMRDTHGATQTSLLEATKDDIDNMWLTNEGYKLEIERLNGVIVEQHNMLQKMLNQLERAQNLMLSTQEQLQTLVIVLENKGKEPNS